MSLFPGGIDEFRTVENLPGVDYNASDTKTVYAEDTNDHSDAIIAIEAALGAGFIGAYETLLDRLTDILPIGFVLKTTDPDFDPNEHYPGTDWTLLGEITETIITE